MSARSRRPLAALLLPVGAALALLIAGDPSAWLAGPPLRPIGLLLLAAIGYAAAGLPRPSARARGWLLLGLLAIVALKLALATTALPLGVVASYWARSSLEGPPERSTEAVGLAGATRMDPALDFQANTFPVHFFNDAARFNLAADAQPARDQLPFSVRWQGWLRVGSDAERRFVLDADGAAHVWLDDIPLLDLVEDDHPRSAAAQRFLPAGLHALRVEYTRPEAPVPRLRLSWDPHGDGRLVPVGAPDVRWQPVGDELPWWRPWLAHLADLGLLLVVASWLALGLVRVRRGGRPALWRAALAALPLVFLIQGMLLHADVVDRATILSGQDDWLIYESSARDILLNGPLMANGNDHAPPFYGQPLYPYVLALAHWLTGESLFGPLALQFAALGGVLASTAVLARRAFGSRLAGLAALALFWAFLQQEHWRVARQLFTENVYMPLVMGSLIALVSLARRRQPPSWRWALLVGLLLGLTAVSRSQFLLSVPFALVVLTLAWRRGGQRGWARHSGVAVAGLLLGLLLAIAPATTRNWLVSHQLVLISSSGGASLLEFHRPPPGLVDTAAIQHDPLFDALGLDEPTRTVVAFVRQDPLGYLATWLPLGAHSIGLPGARGGTVSLYSGFLLTFALYLVAFSLRRVRRLHVWPIHAFVASHLLVMMLFEADTYGYRLVLPMYAPVVVVAAQVPLVVALSVVRRFGRRPGRRSLRLPAALAGLVALAAAVQQGRGLVEVWPDRELVYHGLGGPAAAAVAVADRAQADVIYVASSDGRPRRYGSGVLPGLRYPWLKWFDPSVSLPMPSAEARAVYVLAELAGQGAPGDLLSCLGNPEAGGERVLLGAAVRQRCLADLSAATPLGARFENLVEVDQVHIPDAAQAGDALEARLVWRPLVAHPPPQQVSIHIEDDDQPSGELVWGNGTRELYAANEWQPGEVVLSRLPVETDATAVPDTYRVTLGIGPTRSGAAPLTASWQGARVDRVPVGSINLVPRSDVATIELPSDMRPLAGSPLSAGGLELIAARPPAAEVRPGDRLRIGFLLRALQDGPFGGARFRLRLVRDDGQVVQETMLPIFGRHAERSVLRSGSIVRDEQTLIVAPRLPAESVTLAVDLLDGVNSSASVEAGSRPLGTIHVANRLRSFDDSTSGGTPLQATFGEQIQLVSYRLEPGRAQPGGTLTVGLRWRSLATMDRAYKVFVHVLDPAGDHVVAQRDAEPQDGRAPTTGWLPGEVVDDEYTIALPPGLAAGSYPIEVGLYEAAGGGERLKLTTGASRVLLTTPLEVRPP